MATTTANRTASPVRGYRDLVVWQDSMNLVVAIYRATAAFPKEERYSLVDQLRRAAVSVPSNIAEGHGRSRTGDYLRHLSITVGSLNELETQVQIARRLEYISNNDQQTLLDSCAAIGRMLGGLIRSLRRRLGNQELGAGNRDPVAPSPSS
jgi:four helix bundle protein